MNTVGAKRPIRVIHSVSSFLNVSENWIYPQIVGVPNTKSVVLAKSLVNLEIFPLDSGGVIKEQASGKSVSLRRLFDGAARRLGWNDASTLIRLKRWRPNVLHAHFGTRGWQSLELKLRLGIPLVTSFYGYDAWKLPESQPVWKERFGELFDIGEMFLVEGPAMRDRLVSLGCPVDKVEIHRIGVDMSNLRFEEKDFTSGLRIAMVGRFVEKKGLDDGLRACMLARSRGVELTVTIIGEASDDSGRRIKAELESIANSKELNGRVRFAGFLPLEETRELLKQHNVLLCPSKHAASGDAEGGSPVVLTEAMSLGLLCVGTRHCDIPEVIVEGKTGFLCDEGNTGSLAAAIINVNECREGLKTITEAGSQNISRNFSLETQLNIARDKYQKVISGCDGPLPNKAFMKAA